MRLQDCGPRTTCRLTPQSVDQSSRLRRSDAASLARSGKAGDSSPTSTEGVIVGTIMKQVMATGFELRDEVECHECGEGYKGIGVHWANGSCSYPGFTDKEWEILTGLLMGDGCISSSGGEKPYLTVEITNSEYAYHLWNRFGNLSKDTINYITADEKEERAGYWDQFEGCDFRPTYSWATRAHPLLYLFESWYCTGEKVFPKGIELTPTVLKHWYVGDGSVEQQDRAGRCVITSANEMEDFTNILSMFDDAGFTPYTSGYKIIFNAEESRELLDYMGNPPPGFKHKWLIDDRDAYERQREKDYQPPEELTR